MPRQLFRPLLHLFDRPLMLDPFPSWESRRPAREPPQRLRVLWTGSQVAPAPILLREPDSINPSR